MTVRAYEPTYPPIRMSDETRRKRITLERRGIKRILIDEGLKTVFMYQDEDEEPEAFNHSDYRIEIFEGEPNDSVSDGNAPSY